MKILQVSPNFPFPPNDGGKIVIYYFYKSIRKSGNDIDFICTSKIPVPMEERTAFDKENIPGVFYDRKISSYFRLLKNLLLGKPVLINKFYSRKFQRILMDKVTRGDYDLIHFEGLHSVPYALKLKKVMKDKKMVVRLHNVESQIIYRFFQTAKNPLLKLFFWNEYRHIRRLEKKCYSELKNIIFITEDDRRLALRNDARDIRPYVMTAGVDLDYFSGLDNKPKSNLLYLGSMDWKPNEDAVLWFIKNVFCRLLESYPDLKFFVVGKNPSEKMKKQASSNIIVTGTVDDVRPYVEQAGICVIPLRVGGGMRVKILELMAAGKPIITSTIGAEGINYEKDNELILADTAEDFFREIDGLLRDPDRMHSVGVNAKNKVKQQYSWESVISGYMNYINSIV
ncbi:MAG TPA: glycosyltransferase family 4 protein [Ignavibacteriales bacterium]|nr:glycosyltransferase family 4 protein [Ignavibacteriales bacterium]